MSEEYIGLARGSPERDSRESDGLWSSYDFWLSVALLASGNEFVSTRYKPVNGKSLFLFRDTEKLREDLHLFRNKKLMIEAQSFHGAQRALKGRIYEDKLS